MKPDEQIHFSIIANKGFEALGNGCKTRGRKITGRSAIDPTVLKGRNYKFVYKTIDSLIVNIKFERLEA
jgi:hypothetical protein